MNCKQGFTVGWAERSEAQQNIPGACQPEQNSPSWHVDKVFQGMMYGR
jgi:hypothetical protein